MPTSINARLAGLQAEANAYDLPNKYKLLRKHYKDKSQPNGIRYAWHLTKCGWHIDQRGELISASHPQDYVNIHDALDAYEARQVLIKTPGYDNWIKD